VSAQQVEFKTVYEAYPESLEQTLVQFHEDWDMSTYSGWPEEQIYYGRTGAFEFLTRWLDALAAAGCPEAQSWAKNPSPVERPISPSAAIRRSSGATR
jgi:hypothetical protein